MATPIKLDEFGIGTPGLLKRGSPNILGETSQNKTKNREVRKKKTNYLSTPLLSPKEAVRTAIVSIKSQQRRHRDKKELNRNCIPLNDDSSRRGNRPYRNWFNFPEKSISKTELNNLKETWPHFLENYGKCNRNLSYEPLPMCFNGGGLMIPPEAYNESKRMGAVKNYIEKKQWKQTDFFDKLLTPLISTYQVSGLSISLIDRAKQVVKYQVGLPIDNVSRSVSLDGHAILSKDYFIIIDASKDWRMAYNPFVHGPPFIRFYAAVPLLTPDGYPIGAVTIFDPYVRPQTPANLVETLTNISKTISDFLSAESSKESPRIESAGSKDEKATQFIGINHRKKKQDAKYSLLSVEEPFPELLDPNHRLKFDLRSLKGLKYSPTLVQSYQILNELKDCPDGKSAITKACSTLAETLGLKVVYVVEVRITCSYETKVSQFPFPTGHKFAADSKVEDMIRPGKSIGEPAISINFIGGHNIQGVLHTFDSEVHDYALDSEYGVQYSSNGDDITYRSGIFMPFQKMPNKVVYRARKSKSRDSKRSTDSSTTANTLSSFDDGIGSGMNSYYTTASQQTENSAPEMDVIVEKVEEVPSRKQSVFKGFMGSVRGGKRNGGGGENSGNGKEGENINDKEKHNEGEIDYGKQKGYDDKEKHKHKHKHKHKKKRNSTTIMEHLPDEILKVKIRRSGYVMAGFSTANRVFSPGDVEYMKVCVRALESVLACS